MSGTIKKLLVANRGEIACRVMKTCKRLGIKTVAVYSDADANAMHVTLADEAVCVGPAAATESYLVVSKILGAAKLTGADAIHPGYGFLSENPEFSEACAENDIIFVGPSAASMRAMALKGAAKELMVKSDVPVVPGYHGDDQSVATLAEEAKRIGFPVLIKAVAGGGGKGMRTVQAGDDIVAAIEAARREGENAFGNGKLLIEKLIEMPRHIELQVFGDQTGKAVHLHERDCSLQRRHQKVVEEAPAPGLSAYMRKAMGDAAVKAAEAIKYVGAGTVEFIVDVANGLEDAPFYFMEMNTRLQVEHPVTEYIIGEDLVEWQIRIAEGADLLLNQSEINSKAKGHALEVRLYAEDPQNDFLPSIGKVGLFDPDTPLPPHQRIDAGVKHDDSVTIHYDPMIGKLIAYGETRTEALDALVELVEKTPVTGLTTNRDFLLDTLKHPEFAAGNVHTGFIADHKAILLAPKTITEEDYALASLAIFAARQSTPHNDDPWAATDNYQLNLQPSETLLFDTEDGVLTVTLRGGLADALLEVGNHIVRAQDISYSGHKLTLTVDGIRQSLFADISTREVTLIDATKTKVFTRYAQGSSSGHEADGPGNIIAPMPGKILEIQVANGDAVEKDQPLLVMEAMKMEQTIKATKTGLISGLTLSPGDQVSGHAVLLTITEPEE